jgi:HAE1 family hydrophobic/amphiphilic exporter-1
MLAVHVTANLHGLALGQAAARVDEALKDLRLPAGYHLVTGGEISDQKLAFGPLTLAFVLSLILIYMLMAALYESFVTPMVVLCSLPLATVGAFLLLLLTGQSLNVFSFIAMIMLMGLVAKNAILLVDRGNALIRQGMERTEALVQAGRNRLRPILMTTATLVISMLPLALDRGSGAEDRVSVAVVLIGGMLSSTLLTLIVVPVLYTFFDDLRSKLRTARMRIRRQREADAS